MLALLAAALVQAPAPQPRYDESFENRESLALVYDRWERVRSAAHPAYNGISVERDPEAVDGRHVLRLAVLGGAVGFQMGRDAAWRIDPRRPHRLAVSVRTKGAARNAAVATLQWLDRRLAPLREDASAPLAPGTDWRVLTLDVPSPPADAVWARVRLEYGGDDVRGECRFDALSLSTFTRLELAPAGRRLPIYDPGVPLRFDAAALGLDPGDYTLTLRTSAHAASVPLTPGKTEAVELPPHAPGWYELTAEVAGIRRAASFFVPNPWRSPAPQPRWIGAEVNPFVRDLPAAAGYAQAAGLARLRLRFADLPAAGRRAPDAGALTALARALAGVDQARLTGVLAKPTPDLFPHMGWEEVGGASRGFDRLGRAAWEAPLRALAARHAGAVETWELGEGAGAVRFPAEALARAGSLLTPAPAAATVVAPPGGDAASTALFLRTLLERAASPERPEELFVPLDVPLIDAEGWPLAPLAALRTANDLLTGARVRRDVPPLLNVRELAFEKDGATLLALWSDVETEREAHLGEGAWIHPPLGTARPHRPGERLKIGPLPLFVTGLDAPALESQASLQFYDPRRPDRPDPVLPLRTDPVTRLLKYRNASPDDTLTDLRLRILEPLPPGWQIRPTEQRAASLAPGEELALEALFVLPPDAEEETRHLRIELTCRKAGREQTVRVTRAIDVRSPIGIEASSVPDGENGRVVSLRFTNREPRPLTFVARIRLPGLPEQQEAVGPLEAGTARTLEYRIRDFPRLEPARRVVDVLAEERGGERACARLRAPLR